INQVRAFLDKAEAHAAAKEFDANTLLVERFDMYPLVRHIQGVINGTNGIASRLVGVEPPALADENTIVELRARLDKTSAYLKTLQPEQFQGADDRIVTMPGKLGKRIKGLDYLF